VPIVKGLPLASLARHWPTAPGFGWSKTKLLVKIRAKGIPFQKEKIMGLFKQQSTDYVKVTIGNRTGWALSQDKYDAFNVSILGLGDLEREAREIDAIAVNLDLEAFTNFCKQPDAHLSVPHFTREFLTWLMNKLKGATTVSFPNPALVPKNLVPLYSHLPFFVKFMGDGVLVLYDASLMDAVGRRNVIVNYAGICTEYRKAFLPVQRGKFVDCPPCLHCGIALGKVYAIGDGNDFIGSSINMSSRLLRLPGIRFAFNRKGFDLSGPNLPPFFNEIVIVRAPIRGVNDAELAGFHKSNWDTLSAQDKSNYHHVG
jgi:class 3 adenylate cyclase